MPLTLTVPAEKLRVAVPVPVMLDETAKVPPPKSRSAPEAIWTGLVEEIVPPEPSESVPEETAKLAAPVSLKTTPLPM